MFLQGIEIDIKKIKNLVIPDRYLKGTDEVSQHILWCRSFAENGMCASAGISFFSNALLLLVKSSSQINYESKEPPVPLCVERPQRIGREPAVLDMVIWPVLRFFEELQVIYIYRNQFLHSIYYIAKPVLWLLRTTVIYLSELVLWNSENRETLGVISSNRPTPGETRGIR
jgi:hypothetical protein